ncbi:hypothetical protein ACVIIV_005950 [Bradyrhizobium sp. USDA 4354]
MLNNGLKRNDDLIALEAAQQGVMRRREKVVAIGNRRHEVCFDQVQGWA